MSKHAVTLTVFVMVVVAALIVIGPMVASAGQALADVGTTLENTQGYAALTRYDAGSITAKAAEAALGDQTAEIVAAWCRLNTPTGNMVGVCQNN